MLQGATKPLVKVLVRGGPAGAGGGTGAGDGGGAGVVVGWLPALPLPPPPQELKSTIAAKTAAKDLFMQSL
jgi:hypothetical protein